LTEQAMVYVMAGQYDQALLWIFNDYIGYGIIWMLIGLMLFSVTYQKSRSAAISGLVFAMFLSVINVLLPVEIQMYFVIFVGILLFMVWYKVLR